MKKLFVIFFLSSNLLFAQEETLFDGEMESGGYGAFFTMVGEINNETGVFMGGQGGWIINHRIVLGAKGYGLINKVKVEGMQNTKLEFGCGGGLIEYIIASDKLVHVNVFSMIGAGGVKYAVIDYQNPNSPINYTEDSFFVFEPGADVILNVNPKFRVGIGVSYRLVSGVNYEDLSNAGLSGFSGRIILKFGKF
jgi:hypothetical protein